MNLSHIAEGWYNYVKGSEKVRKLMKKRLDICDTCPHKIQTTGAGVLLVQAMGNGIENIFTCNLCNCPLGALASVQHPACKAGYWNTIT